MEYVLHRTTLILLAAALGACGGSQTSSGKPGAEPGGRTGTTQNDGFGDAGDGAGGGDVTPADEDVEVPPAP